MSRATFITGRRINGSLDVELDAAEAIAWKLQGGQAVVIQDRDSIVPGRVVDNGLGCMFVRASRPLQHRLVRVRRPAEVTS